VSPFCPRQPRWGITEHNDKPKLKDEDDKAKDKGAKPGDDGKKAADGGKSSSKKAANGARGRR
jgi:hypothetical protein